MTIESQHQIGALSTCIFTGFLAAFVLFKESRRPVTRLFGIYTIAISAWSFCWLGMISAAEYSQSLFWARFLHVPAAFIPAAFLHFVQHLLDISTERKQVLVLRLFYGLGAVFCFTCLTHPFVADVVPKLGFRYYLEPGPYYVAFLVFFVAAIGYIDYLLFRSFWYAKGRKKTQIGYVLSAYVIGYAGGAAVFLPVYHVPIPSMVLYTVPLCHLIIAYTILAHRFLDIELLARDTVTKVLAWTLMGLPLFMGALLAYFLGSRPGFLNSRGPGDLACIVLNYSLALTLLKNYGDPCFKILRQFFILLGTWELMTLILTAAPHAWSAVVFRFGYAIGTLVLYAWFNYWQAYFDNSKNKFSTILRWGLNLTVPLMWILAGHTSGVVRGLRFDPSGYLPAVELPGRFYPLYVGWFIGGLLLMNVWAILSLFRFSDASFRPLKKWALGCLGLATCTAGSYFLFVMGRSSWWFFQAAEIAMCLSAAAALSARQRLLEPAAARPLALGFGVTSLVLPFIAGAMLGQAILIQSITLCVAGALLVAFFAPRIVEAIQESVTALVDRVLFNQFSHYADLHKWVRGPFLIDSLKRDIPEIASGMIQRAQLRSCTIMVHLEELASIPHEEFSQELREDGRIFGGAPWLKEWYKPLLHVLKRQHVAVLREEEIVKETALAAIDPNVFEAAAPLLHNGQVFGMVVAGPKRRKASLFNKEDIKALETLTHSIEGPLWNNRSQYTHAMTMETGLHDTSNGLDNMVLRWQKFGLKPIDLGAMYWMIADLVKDMRELNLNSIERLMGTPPEMRPVDIAGVLKEVCHDQSIKASWKKLELILELPAALPPVLGKKTSLMRCVANLIGNAIKYTAEGGVTVSARLLPAGEIQIDVADTGAGIPADYLNRIFNPFMRVPGKQLLKEGTGLGLHMVKDYSALIGGRVGVESELGKGSVFHLWLPAAQTLAQAA